MPTPLGREAGLLEANVFALFARQAAATPDAIAISAADGEVSYAWLAARAADVARFLADRGVAAEEPLGVLMNRSAELVAVLLGIWKAGAAYVPFEPDDPPARIRRLLMSCGCRTVLGGESLLGPLRTAFAGDPDAGTAPTLCDVSRIPATPVDSDAMACAPGGARLGYLLFTSGSTGDPKAVAVEHHSIVRLLLATRDLLDISAADRQLAATTVSFDVSVPELFVPLITGASVLLRDRNIQRDPRRLARDVRDHGVTMVQTGPAVWRAILSEVPDFPRVRVAITTGEAIAPELAQRLAACGDQVWNLYGPTETTVWATAHRLVPVAGEDASAPSAPIGTPLPHVHVAVIDTDLNPLPDGSPGELAIGGGGVARGYHGNMALTRERFVTLGHDGGRYYRSGDLVVRDATGVLHYFGRLDDQVKIRGVRIEPAEVEAALGRDPRVAQAAVTWFETDPGSRALVAAVVTRAGRSCSAPDLRTRLEAELPPQLIPSRFLFVTDVPLTAGGKVDRVAIRVAAASAAPSPSSTRRRPLTETEAALAGIWQRQLRVDAVAPDDHYYALGGDSMAAVQMIVEAEARFGVQLSMHWLLAAPTLEGLARTIDTATAQPAAMTNPDFVFRLVEQGTAPPLFFCGVDLAVAGRNTWQVPCPLYAVSLWALGTGFVRAASLSALAAVQLESIRRVQPRGPYRLGGFSMGGLVAFELAQQLVQQGEVVEVLFLLAPTHPLHTAGTSRTRYPFKRAPLLHRVAGRARRLVQGPGRRGFRAWLKELVPYARFPGVNWATYHLVHLYGRKPNPVSAMLLPRNRWPGFWFAAKRLIATYAARPYAGPTLAVFPDEGPVTSDAWPSLLGPGAEIHVFEAPHEAMFTDPVMARWMPLLARFLAKP